MSPGPGGRAILAAAGLSQLSELVEVDSISVKTFINETSKLAITITRELSPEESSVVNAIVQRNWNSY